MKHKVSSLQVLLKLLSSLVTFHSETYSDTQDANSIVAFLAPEIKHSLRQISESAKAAIHLSGKNRSRSQNRNRLATEISKAPRKHELGTLLGISILSSRQRKSIQN